MSHQVLTHSSLLLALAAAGCAPARIAGPEAARSPTAIALADADSLHIQPLTDGVLYLRAWDRAGPWAVHVIEVDTSRCAPRWLAQKPDGPLSGRALTSSLAAGALAAVNADFFQLPGGTPVGPHVSGGRVLIGPGERPAWVWSDPVMVAGPVRLDGVVAAGPDSVPLRQVNRAARATSAYRPPSSGATLFTPPAALVAPADSGADVVFIAIESGDERAGAGRVLRVVASPRDTLRLGSGEAAIQLYGADRDWAARRAPGERVEWRAMVRAAGGDAPAVEAVGGFPLLLRDGRDVLGEATVAASFGAQRHPRTAIGWSTESGRAFLVAVDGRQPPYSDGMTLPELLALFRRLGATDALNLDGGGSTAVVVGGRVVNRPSDAAGERAVGNALALAACAAPAARAR